MTVRYIDIIRLSDYLYSNGLKSYDPCDITSSPIYSYFENTIKPRIPYISKKYSVYSLEKYIPMGMRCITPKTKSAMVSAIYASSQFKLYNVSNDDVFLSRGIKELNWLVDHSCRGYSGMCWGLPFDWLMAGEILAKRGIPFPTVTYYATSAFITGYKITKNENYRDAAESTIEFIKKDLYSREFSEKKSICMSYSPIDRFNVVNVNAYCAAMIASLKEYNTPKELDELAFKLINGVISEQHQDGSWDYWGRFETRPKCVDSLHQIYILKMLHECYCKGYKSPELFGAINRGIEFFNNTFFHRGEIWKFETRVGNTLELIDHAEALSMYTKILGGNSDHARHTSEYILRNFTFKYMDFRRFKSTLVEGVAPYYYSIIRPWNKTDMQRENTIPFFRWGFVQLLDAMADLWIFQLKEKIG